MQVFSARVRNPRFRERTFDARLGRQTDIRAPVMLEASYFAVTYLERKLAYVISQAGPQQSCPSRR